MRDWFLIELTLEGEPIISIGRSDDFQMRGEHKDGRKEGG